MGDGVQHCVGEATSGCGRRCRAGWAGEVEKYGRQQGRGFCRGEHNRGSWVMKMRRRKKLSLVIYFVAHLYIYFFQFWQHT